MYDAAQRAERADTIARNRYDNEYNAYKNANNGAPPPRPIGPPPAAGQQIDPYSTTNVDPFGRTHTQSSSPPAGGSPCPAPPCGASSLSKSVGGQLGIANAIKGGS
jgi:hypothetical protein